MFLVDNSITVTCLTPLQTAASILLATMVALAVIYSLWKTEIMSVQVGEKSAICRGVARSVLDLTAAPIAFIIEET